MSVHAPLSLPFVQLVLVMIFLWFERRGQNLHTAWMALFGGLIMVLVSDSYTYWTGLHDAAQSPLSARLIAEHTQWAQIFLGLSLMSLGSAGLIVKAGRLGRLFWWSRGIFLTLSVLKAGAAGLVGHLGGMLVFGS